MTIQILEQIIEQYGKDIYSFCLRLTGQKEAVEELYQDVWLMALKQIDVLEEDKNIRSFLLSVAINRWHNQKRKYAWRKRIVPKVEYVDEMVNQQAEEKEEGLSRFLNKERNEVVKAAVAKLNKTVYLLDRDMKKMDVSCNSGLGGRWKSEQESIGFDCLVASGTFIKEILPGEVEIPQIDIDSFSGIQLTNHYRTSTYKLEKIR